MSTFYQQWYKSAQSGSTVKLIRFGKVFADVSPDAYTGSWNATLSQYEFTLDTSTFIDATTYRIEDGSGNVVVKDFVVHPPIFDETAIPDNFVKNDADDSIIGELTIKPASGTDSQLRVGDEDGDSIRITSENAAKSTARILEIKAISIGLMAQDGATAIKITNLADGTSANDAVNKSQLTSITGGSAVTISALDTRVVALEGGTGTFSGSPAVTLAGATDSDGISINWAMDSGNAAAVLRFEVYASSEPLAGYSAGAVNSTVYNNIIQNMRRVNLTAPRDRNAYIPAHRSLYIIVVAFDHTATPVMYGSANTLFSPGSAIDPATALVGGADSLAAAVEILAGEIDAVQTSLGSSGAPPIVLFDQNSVRAAAGGSDAAALTEWTETTGTAYIIQRGYLDKNTIYKFITVFVSGKISSGTAITVEIVCSGLSISQTFSASGYVRESFKLDISSLADNGYEYDIKLKGNGTGTATATGLRVLHTSS